MIDNCLTNVISKSAGNYALHICGEVLTKQYADPAVLLDAWIKKTVDPHQLNGRFFLAFHEQNSRKWTCYTDRLGSYHVYFVWRFGKIVAIGNDLKLLVQRHSERELDREALASFFAFGFFLDDSTYYTDVRILLPASVYEIDDEGTLTSHYRYWTWHHTVDESRSYDETIDTYHALLTQAVSRTCGSDQVILPISGGLDSRSIAAVIPEDHPVQTYSYGYTDDSVETHIARQVATARRWKFTSHTIRPYLFDRLSEIVTRLHGSQDVTQARQMSVNSWVNERAQSILTGLWGDLICDHIGSADNAGKPISAFVIQRFEKRGHHWVLQRLFQNAEEVYESLHNRVLAGLNSFSYIQDVDFRVKVYKTSQWVFRWSNASLRGFEPGATPRIPYYDVDLVDFFCTVPTVFVANRRLQVDHLKRYSPDLAHIRWQSSGTNLYHIQHAKWLSLPERAFRKSLRILRRHRPIQRNWEVQFLSPQGRNLLEGVLLKSNHPLHDWFQPRDVRSLIDAFYAQPDAANGYTVSILLTFAAWLEAIG